MLANFSILFYSAKQPAIQNVINNLRISELVHCDESDPEVSRYIQRRTVEPLEVCMDSDKFVSCLCCFSLLKGHLFQCRYQLAMRLNKSMISFWMLYVHILLNCVLLGSLITGMLQMYVSCCL